MANLSQTDIEMYGTDEAIAAATADIKSIVHGTDPDFLYLVPNKGELGKNGYNSLEADQLDFNPNSIIISGSGRWAGPDKYIAHLMEEYGLTGTYTDSENGCNFFYRTEFEEGKLTKEIESSYFSNESIKYFGIDYFLEHYAYISEEDDWEDDWKDEIKLFADNGYSFADLKEAWKGYT